MRLNVLRERVRSLTGIRLQSLRSDKQIDSVIDQVYQELLSLTPWPFLRSETTVSLSASVNEFETPEEFSEVLSVSYTFDDSEVVRMKQTTLDELDNLEDEDGEPVYYARIDEKSFRIWPRPQNALTLRIRGKLVAESLTESDDEPLFAEQFHPILAYRAASMILGEEGDDSGRAQFYQTESNNFYNRMRQYYIRSSDVGMVRMGSNSRRRFLDAYRGRPASRF